MADVVSEVANRTGIPPELVRKGVGAVLALMKDKLPANVYSQIQSAVPDAAGLVSAAPEAAPPAGGVLGAVTAAAGKLLGGAGGDAAVLTSRLTQTGFSAEQLEKFLPAVMEFLKSRLPENTVKQLTGLLPAFAESHA
jgi:hypothetical protein